MANESSQRKLNLDCRPYLPPEWATQSAVMVTWPHSNTDWASNLASTEQVFVDIAKTVVEAEQLIIVCNNPDHQLHIEKLLEKYDVALEQVRFIVAESNDSWARDHGPLTVTCQDEPLLLDFQFNGWGKKYPAELDNKINRTLSSNNCFGDTPMESIKLVLEGGSIEVDGSGSLMTTESCLLSKTRNADLSKIKIEKLLSEYFGITQTLWLTSGALAGDDTDGHIDTLARFCNIDTIAYSSCTNQDDPNYDSLKEMEAELHTFKNIRGKPYRLIPLPLPEPVYDNDGNQLPATYANFLIINGAVLLPIYNTPTDKIAEKNLALAFSDRKIIPINCLPLIQQHGSLHCVTMQFPAQLKL